MQSLDWQFTTAAPLCTSPHCSTTKTYSNQSTVTKQQLRIYAFKVITSGQQLCGVQSPTFGKELYALLEASEIKAIFQPILPTLYFWTERFKVCEGTTLNHVTGPKS